jgi:hypothetical protein
METNEFLDRLDSQLEKFQNLTGLRTSFYDKLIVLNGGTLTISFTAATSFHDPNAQWKLLDLSNLFSAWELLIIASVLSFISNYLTLGVVTNQMAIMSNRLMNAYGVVWSKTAPEKTIESERQNQRSERVLTGAKYSEKIALWLGVIAQMCTVYAYICLFKFARLNLSPH